MPGKNMPLDAQWMKKNFNLSRIISYNITQASENDEISIEISKNPFIYNRDETKINNRHCQRSRIDLYLLLLFIYLVLISII